jgi:rfaE bifunctional protein nucleotidyltransferase chain/domain
MSKIISVKKAIKLSKNIHANKKNLAIAGGCFDILHMGHIKFLKNAKKQANYLFILLESDESVKKLKGEARPINSQADRAEILSAINFVDYVIPLERVLTNTEWDKLIINLNPDIITVTKDDPKIVHNKRQAKEINAKVIEVIARIENKSSTNLAKLIEQNF